MQAITSSNRSVNIPKDSSQAKKNTGRNTQKGTGNKSARQLAFEALRAIDRGAFADVIIDRKLSGSALTSQDKGLVTELVYGTVRRQRTLDALIDQFGKRKASAQQADLLQILRLGFYQLRYLDHVPDHAVVDTTVQLAKDQRLGKLSGVVNGMLRAYIRASGSNESSGESRDPLTLPEGDIARLSLLHSYPEWIVQVWASMLPGEQVAQLCEYFNQPPKLDLRIDLRRYSLTEARDIFSAGGVAVTPVEGVPSALRLAQHSGAVTQLPGYAEGWWTVQDSSAQLVGYLLDPQPGELVIDAC
ncbi:MAG: transcription antitermination factor NusB, partial [Cyanobacteria bacterium J06650_10]